MAKYEAKITRSSHMRSMITAVSISLVVGVGAGYILGSAMPGDINKQSTKSTVQTQVQKSTAQQQPVQDNGLGKEEQTAYIKGVLNSFYNINLVTYNSIKSESLNESATKKVSQDSIFKDKLLKQYQEILAKDQLQNVTNFINKGSLKTNYFFDYFNHQEGSVVSSVENIEYKGKTISAKVLVTNPFEYGGTYSIPSSQTFFGELKGKGVTTTQYSKLLGQKPSKVNLTETKEITLSIENISGRWMITSMKDALVSSEISNATIKGKKVTFGDLLKNYMK